MDPINYFYVYLLGFFITYIVHKKYIVHEEDDDEWVDVLVRVGLGITWPAILILLCMFIAHEFVVDRVSRLFKNSKPPKWL